MNETPLSDDGELTCQEFVDLVTDYLENALAAPRRAQFEAHLLDCEGCETYLAQMRHAVQLLGKLDENSIPADGKDKLLQAFRAWKFQ